MHLIYFHNKKYLTKSINRTFILEALVLLSTYNNPRERKPMIEMIFTALGLSSLFQAHSKELSVMPLEGERRSGEYRRDFL